MSADPDETIIEFMELTKGSIREFYFAEKPKFDISYGGGPYVLDMLYDHHPGPEPILFRFDESYVLGPADLIADLDWSHNIRSACLESDSFFEDETQWFEFSRIECLTIYAPLKQSHWFEEGLNAFQRGVVNMSSALKRLNVVLVGEKDLVSEAKEWLIWPDAKFECSVEKKKYKRKPSR